MPSALVFNNEVEAFYAGDVPGRIHFANGGTVDAAAVGYSNENGYSILPAVYDTPPSETAYSTGQTYAVSNGEVQVTRTWVTPEPQPASLTFLQFLALFTPAEQAAIVASSDIQVRLFLLMATGAQEIILSDPKTAAGVNYLASQGFITSERAAQILAAQQ